VRRLLPKLWRQKNWLLHHGNAPFLISFFHQGIFDQKQHDCRSPPTLFFSVFSQLNIKLKERYFDTIEVTKAESQVVVNTLTEHDF
jgi:hypothetical protein